MTSVIGPLWDAGDPTDGEEGRRFVCSHVTGPAVLGGRARPHQEGTGGEEGALVDLQGL